jgi:hypothetical protein
MFIKQSVDLLQMIKKMVQLYLRRKIIGEISEFKMNFLALVTSKDLPVRAAVYNHSSNFSMIVQAKIS